MNALGLAVSAQQPLYRRSTFGADSIAPPRQPAARRRSPVCSCPPRCGATTRAWCRRCWRRGPTPTPPTARAGGRRCTGRCTGASSASPPRCCGQTPRWGFPTGEGAPPWTCCQPSCESSLSRAAMATCSAGVRRLAAWPRAALPPCPLAGRRAGIAMLPLSLALPAACLRASYEPKPACTSPVAAPPTHIAATHQSACCRQRQQLHARHRLHRHAAAPRPPGCAARPAGGFHISRQVPLGRRQRGRAAADVGVGPRRAPG